MSEAFDPYRKWLGIPPSQQPPHHYRLLGIELYESDVEVIDTAAGQRMSYLQELAGGQYVKESQKLLNEVSAARRLLLDKKRKAEYDAELKAKLAATSAPTPPPISQPNVPAMPFIQPAADGEAEETITLNISEATAKLKKRDVTPGVKAPAVKTPAGKTSAKGPAAKVSEGADRLDGKPAAPRTPKPRKSINVPAVVLAFVVILGVGVYLVRSRTAPVVDDEVHAVAPMVAHPSDDDYADRLRQMQKEEQAILESLNKKAGSKNDKDIFSATTKATSGGTRATTPPASASVALPTGTPAKSIFDLPPSSSLSAAAPQATGSAGAPAATATGTKKSWAEIRAEQAAKKAQEQAAAKAEALKNQEEVKEAMSLFSVSGAADRINAPKATATGSAAKPASAPSATPSATQNAKTDAKKTDGKSVDKKSAGDKDEKKVAPTSTEESKSKADDSKAKSSDEVKAKSNEDAKDAAATQPTAAEPVAKGSATSEPKSDQALKSINQNTASGDAAKSSATDGDGPKSTATGTASKPAADPDAKP